MRVITGLTIALAGMLSVIIAARAQVVELEPDASVSVVRVLAGELPLREIGVDAAVDERLYKYSSPDGRQSHVLITDKGQVSARSGDIVLDIPKDKIKWVGLARRDWALGVLGGLSLDVDWRPHRGGDRLLGLLEGHFQDGQLDVLGVDISSGDVRRITEASEGLRQFGTVPQPRAGTQSSLMIGLYGTDIWRLRPDMVVRQVRSRGASQIIIDLPMTVDMSFPQFSIELRQLLQKAHAGDIAVWVRPSTRTKMTIDDLARLFAGIGAYNDLHSEGVIAGVYLPFIPQDPDQQILSPDTHHSRFMKAVTDLQLGNTGGLIMELPYGVWQAMDAGQKASLENVAQIGLVVSEDEASRLMQAKEPSLPSSPSMLGDATDGAFEAQDQIGEAEKITETVAPGYRLVFRSLRPKAFARMTFARGNPGRLHIYFQGDQAVILLLAAPAPALGGNGFILDYLQSPITDAENYLGRETAMWTQAKKYEPTEFDFSQKNAIFMGSIILETD